MRPRVLGEMVAQHADAHAAQVALPSDRAEVGHRRARAARITGVVAGDRLQHQRGVLDRARHRPHVVAARRERDDAAASDHAEGRLEPDDAAHPGGRAHRPTGIRAEREGCKAGRHDRAPSPSSSFPCSGRCSTGCAPAATAGRTTDRRGRIRAARACRAAPHPPRRAASPLSRRCPERCLRAPSNARSSARRAFRSCPSGRTGCRAAGRGRRRGELVARRRGRAAIAFSAVTVMYALTWHRAPRCGPAAPRRARPPRASAPASAERPSRW